MEKTMKNRIKELRLEKGLRQKDVADILGISPQSFCNYENWINKPEPEMLVRLADLFEVSVDYLLCREDEYGVISPLPAEQYSEDELRLIEAYRSFSEPVKELARRTFAAWRETDGKKR